MFSKCIHAVGLACVVLMGLLQFSVAAHAAGGAATLAFRASTGLQYDDNFRVAQAGQEVSERIATQSLGVNLSMPVSLQQFDLDYSVNFNKHQNFASADYTAQNYRAAWQWSYTPRLRGSLYTSRAETLNATQDNLNVALRNKNTSLSTGLSVSYGLAGPWQLQGGLTTSKSMNEQAILGGGDSDSNSVSAGLRYTLGPATNINYNFSRGRGNSSSTNDIGAVFTSGTTTTSHSINVAWSPTAKTSISANLQRQSNAYDSATSYDFSSLSGGVSVSHQLTAKTSLSGNWQRQVASKQTTTASHSQTDSLSISANWKAMPKVSVSVPLSVSWVADQGGSGSVVNAKQDTTYSTGVSVSWQPRPFASVSGSLNRTRHSSSIPGLDYVVSKTALDANFNF